MVSGYCLVANSNHNLYDNCVTRSVIHFNLRPFYDNLYYNVIADFYINNCNNYYIFHVKVNHKIKKGGEVDSVSKIDFFYMGEVRVVHKDWLVYNVHMAVTEVVLAVD